MIFGTVLMLGAAFWGCFQIVGLLAHEEWTEHFEQPAAGLTVLRVKGDNGRVTVRGADTDTIDVNVELSRGLFDIDTSATVAGQEYVLSADCPPLGNEWCWARYDVVVPRDLSVVIDTDNGRVVVDGVAGTVDVGSDNGRVELDDVSGAVRVRTDNGRVIGSALASATVDVGTDNGRIELAFAAPPSTVTATSSNGHIDIALPAVDGGYNIESPRTDNGSVELGIASDPTSARLVRTETDNGDITIRTP